MYKLIPQSRRPDITFHRNGFVRIAARAARLLSLRPGDSINILVEDGEYLLFASPASEIVGRLEARCYRSKKSGETFCANSVRLCRALMDAARITAERAAFLTSEVVLKNNIKYLPIITRRPL